MLAKKLISIPSLSPLYLIHTNKHITYSNVLNKHCTTVLSLIHKKICKSPWGNFVFSRETLQSLNIQILNINKHICMNIQFNLRAEFFFYINTSSIERIVKINLVEHSVKRFLLLSHKSFLSFVCLLLFSSVTKTRMQYCV